MESNTLRLTKKHKNKIEHIRLGMTDKKIKCDQYNLSWFWFWNHFISIYVIKCVGCHNKCRMTLMGIKTKLMWTAQVVYCLEMKCFKNAQNVMCH